MDKYKKAELLELIESLELPEISKSKKKSVIIEHIESNVDEDTLSAYMEEIPPTGTIRKRISKRKKDGGILSNVYNLPKITKEEQRYEMDRPVKLYEGGTPFDLVPGSPATPIVKLEKHQVDFLNSFCFSGIRGAIAFHGVGTGKTNLAVSVVTIYLKLYPNNKVVFISPPVLLPNFIESLAKYGVDPGDERITYYTYDGFYKSSITLENTLLIVDEAHNYRTVVSKESDEYMSAAGSKRSADLTNRAQLSHKALLLTGTAFVNKLFDIENLLAVANGQPPKSEQTFYQIIEDRKIRYDYMKYRISMYFREIDYRTNKKQEHDPNFPILKETYVPIVSDDKRIIAKASRNNPVYSVSRQVSLNEEKIKYCAKIINENPNKKYVIYTAFLGGVDKLVTKMSTVKYGVISGEVNIKEKASAISDFNNNKIRLLIITKAGSEGVSLMATSGIFIIDGVWNEAAYTQIVARAVRYKSHAKLPLKDREVMLYKLFVCTQAEKDVIEALNMEKDGDNFIKQQQS